MDVPQMTLRQRVLTFADEIEATATYAHELDYVRGLRAIAALLDTDDPQRVLLEELPKIDNPEWRSAARKVLEMANEETR